MPTWDGESYCCEEGCSAPAMHELLTGFVGDDMLVELVCPRHAGLADPAPSVLHDIELSILRTVLRAAAVVCAVGVLGVWVVRGGQR